MLGHSKVFLYVCEGERERKRVFVFVHIYISQAFRSVFVYRSVCLTCSFVVLYCVCRVCGYDDIYLYIKLISKVLITITTS